MPDWRSEIERQLAALKIDPVRRNDVIEELVQHFESLFGDLISDGATPEEASRMLLEELRESELLEAELRRVECEEIGEDTTLSKKGRRLAAVWQDLRFAIRMLRKHIGFTMVAVVTLALGIGATTAIFSVLYAVLFEPMPYPKPDQLVMVWSTVGTDRNVTSAADYLEWKRRNTVFQNLAAWNGGGKFNLATIDRPEQVTGGAYTAGLFNMVGYPFASGRDFLPEECRPGNDRVVIISNKLWKQQFGADPELVGKQVRMNGEPYTVVGILAPGLTDRHPNQLSVPLVFTPELINHDFHWLLVMGRLKDGVSLEQAQSEMHGIAMQLAEEHPETNANSDVAVQLLHNNFMPDATRRNLWLLLAVVGCLLLIACVNIANLLLSRGASREKEVAIRAAIGASKSRLVGQFLIESVVLAFAGGVLGLIAGRAIIAGILAILPPDLLPSEADIRISLPVFLFAVGSTMLAGLLFGSAPAWQATRLSLNAVMKQGGRTGGSEARRGLRRTLVVVEFGLALTLLTAGGMALRSFWNLTRIDLGIRSDHVLTFTLPVAPGRLRGREQISNYYRQLLERIQTVPGIESAAVTTGMPIRGAGFGLGFNVSGRPAPPPSEQPGAGFEMVTPDYFRTFGISILSGRGFTEQDDAGNQRVAIVSASLARRYFPDEDPLTQRIKIPELIPGTAKLGPPVEWQIVGVVNNVANLDGSREDFPEVYVPFWQSPWPGLSVALRTSGETAGLIDRIAEAVNSVDPDVPVAGVKTMDQQIHDILANDRFAMVLYAGFAILALLLAGVGIYGVMAFGVAQRTHEFGVRMALGASRGTVLGLVLKEGSALACVGLLVGLAGSYAVGRVMEGTLYQVGRIDGVVLLGISAVLVSSALLACFFPAHRASRVDPIEALRYE